MNKLTQRERVLEYLRARRKATNMELVMALAIACPWKRLNESMNRHGEVFDYRDGEWRATGEKITRHTVERGGKMVTEYRLTGVKR